MIDARFTFAPASDVIAVDLWEDGSVTLPGRAVKVETRRWWLLDGIDIVAVRAGVGEHGVVAAIGGGLACATITGPGWRDLLSVSSLFDSHDPQFAERAVRRTVIHHVAVTIHLTGAEACEVYCAASYAQTLDDLWRRAVGGS